MIGRRLAHYEIVEKLGQGGMGAVYRARDTRLGRDVAIKVLPGDTAHDPERRARFEREARAVAALKHPNIVTIYSVEEADGVPFLTLELVEGRALSELIPPGGMELGRFFEFAVPLADAMGWAHDRGITHRDLKPGNVMVDRDGRLKVLDFGLAKVLSAFDNLEGAETVVRTHDTAAGRILGTPSYMSPEQAEGKPIDHRSDIFSLGIVLYEMATGTRPFEGDTPISTISSILKDTPKSVSELKPANPRELGRVIAHCMEKDPERRFQTAKDIRNELEALRREIDSGEIVPPHAKPARAGAPWKTLAAIGAAVFVVVAAAWVILDKRGDGVKPPWPQMPESVSSGTPAQPAERQMAVVLPFENLGPAEDAYFAAGVTEEITSRLTAVSGLGVISRTSAENYATSGKTLKQIGADLGVDYVLEGSVRWAKSEGSKGRVRITPQLVRVADDMSVWSETYDREVTDIFDVQTDIATHVVEALGVTLQGNERERLGERPTSSVEAYELYTQAITTRCDWVMGNCAEQMVAKLEKAVALDPNFIAAWYVLSRTHSLLYHLNFDRTETRIARAKAALDRADAIDPNHPFTRLARGFYYYYAFRDYDRALTEFVAAAHERPNDAEIHWSIALIYRRQGKFDESVKEFQRAIELDPHNYAYISDLADTYDAMRLPDQSMELYERSLAITLDVSNLNDMIFTSLRFYGNLAEARRLLVRSDDPGMSRGRFYVAWYARDFAAASEAARSGLAESTPAVQAIKQTMSSIADLRRLGPDAARPELEKTIGILEDVLRESPGNYDMHMQLAWVYANSGRADDAVREAKLAADLSAKDELSGPMALQMLAMVYAQTGQPELALELVERLLATRYDDPLTIPQLKLDPNWDALRGNPKFEELLRQSEQRRGRALSAQAPG
ncbi:MAG TPA: protein kinase [Candidatus Krumholzibacteria bacterium]|nr:protein kinase [Candidatus Krumholzibacteria bacterium]